MSTHGRFGAVYLLRPNGFDGAGKNDLTWGSGFNGAATSYFEVVIDGNGTPDTFKWRVNGGAWTETVGITGGAQTLSDTQTVTFASTTGHTVGDAWEIGNFKDEGCSESGSSAQVTEATRRFLNPNSPPTFTDSGGKTVTRIDYVRGIAYFTGAVATVTVTGNNGFVRAAALDKAGYMYGWTLDASVEIADASVFGTLWKSGLPGLAEASGSCEGYFSTTQWHAIFEDGADGTKKFHLLELYSYDPDDDQTGDHWTLWATISNWNVTAAIGAVVSEKLSFQAYGDVVFTANS
jgi:hypothetical protein